MHKYDRKKLKPLKGEDRARMGRLFARSATRTDQ